jgi:hypothetical protein
MDAVRVLRCHGGIVRREWRVMGWLQSFRSWIRRKPTQDHSPVQRQTSRESSEYPDDDEIAELIAIDII